MSKYFFSRDSVLGWLIIIGVGLSIYTLLAPKAFEVFDKELQIRQSHTNLLRYVDRLNQPPPTDIYGHYEVFILAMPNDIDSDLLTNSHQSNLAQMVKASGMKLRKLERIDTSPIPTENLESLSLSIETEGDYESASDLLQKIGHSPEPFLLSELNLTALPVNGRADLRLRLSATVTVLFRQETNS